MTPWFYTGQFKNGTDGMITANYDFDVDWGDGSKIEHFDATLANSDGYIPVSHSYSNDGIYRVTIKGICENLYGYDAIEPNVNDSGGIKKSPSVINTLWGVCVPKGCESCLHYAYGSFFGCKKMKYVGPFVFDKLVNCKTLYHLFDETSIDYFYPYVLSEAKNVESLSFTFRNCKIKNIDKDLLKNCNKTTTVSHVFHRCNKLTEIPEGLFDNMINLQDVSFTFKACTDLTSVPYNLFDNCPYISNFNYCFSGGKANGDNDYSETMKINTPLPPMWERENASGVGYAHGCTNSPNYEDAVEYGWT